LRAAAEPLGSCRVELVVAADPGELDRPVRPYPVVQSWSSWGVALEVAPPALRAVGALDLPGTWAREERVWRDACERGRVASGDSAVSDGTSSGFATNSERAWSGW
jgi:hypothetical protein